MNFNGQANRLDADDIARASASLDCEPECVRTVCKVEAPKGGFLDDGRPQILFESHAFHTLTRGAYDATHPWISTPTWVHNYGAEGSHQYDRLAEAMALDEVAALKSASWGLFQIMGSNCVICGFPDVHDFVSSMLDGEGAHLDAFVAFVKHNAAMWDALRSRNWANFARWYNGPGQIDVYSGKLAAAYDTIASEAPA